MKKQILTFIIGVLVGAIIATGVFFIIKGNTKTNGKTGERPSMSDQMKNDGERPEMPNGEMPELPEGETDGNTKGRPNGGQKGTKNNTSENKTETNDNSSNT